MGSDERMKELVKLLNKYAYQYYVLDEPTVADVQYDMLYNELSALEKETGIVLPDSPTRKIGGDPIKEFAPHKHIKSCTASISAIAMTNCESGAKRLKR